MICTHTDMSGTHSMTRCLICDGHASHYFTKPDVPGLGANEFWRCGDCGFVYSKTLRELSEDEFLKLNERCMTDWHGREHNDTDPRWRERMRNQAGAIRIAADARLISRELPWLDYACGDGWLADAIGAQKYDPYMGDHRTPPLPVSYGFVVTTSVFEHFRRWEDFEAVEDCVAADGVMSMHTLVVEDVPRDPNWFYLLPMHCALLTNRAMSVLLSEWGYKCSAYCVPARLWFFFRNRDGVERKVRQLGWQYKDGFCDYWKCEPKRFDRERAATA